MTWAEMFVNNFNHKEKNKITNILVPCLTKVGQNAFSSDTEPFDNWLKSLEINALYKSLLSARNPVNL